MTNSKKFSNYVHAQIKLHALEAKGQGDTPAATRWRQESDKLFAKLNREERDRAHEIRRKLFR